MLRTHLLVAETTTKPYDIENEKKWMLGRKRYRVHIFKRRKLAHNCTTLNKRDFFSRVKQHLCSKAEDSFFFIASFW